MYSQHEAYSGHINASAERAFALLDDQTRLTEHMSKRSWKLGWGKMETVLDAQQGRAVGSHIVVAGRVFGVQLYVDEVVTNREPPRSKTWETVGEPRLLVIGPYRMGFDVRAHDITAQVRVTIEYDVPSRGVSWLLGRLLGRAYAQWCTRRMVLDAQRAFAARAH